MTTHDDSLRDKVSHAAKMNQEPKDRMWGVVIVVIILVIGMGALLAESRLFLEEGNTLGYRRGSVDCLILIVDKDREFELPSYCHNQDVVVYYPPDVCDTYFPNNRQCGLEERR